MNWLDKQVSLYSCLADNTGRPATMREVLLSSFAYTHEWFFYDHAAKKWQSDSFNDLSTIIDLRTQEMTRQEKMMLKATLQCFTPAGLLETKKKGQIKEISRSGLLQLDFDYEAIKDYDIEELKMAIFDLPFIAFCGLSCTGKGFYALALIAEPEKLQEYAERCFDVLKYYAVPPDTSKGRNVNDLRFVSYDCRMLVRENPEPLRIKPSVKRTITNVAPSNFSTKYSANTSSRLAEKAAREISGAAVGTRWPTVQKWAYTLGGLKDRALLDIVKSAIKSSTQFDGEEDKYCQCAEVCFAEGMINPLTNKHKP